MKWADSGGEFKQPPLGTHLARCIGVIDLGTQHSEMYDVTQPKVAVRWELPTELMEDGRPFICQKIYTQSLNEKSNLYGDLVNWRGKEFTAEELKGFDARNILDKTCMVSLTEKNGKARVTGIMKGPKHMEVPARVNDLVYFSLDPEDFDRSVFEGLGKWFKEEIMKSPEWAELTNGSKPPVADGTDPDDIPFSWAEHGGLKNMLQVRGRKEQKRVLQAPRDERRSAREVQGMHEEGCRGTSAKEFRSYLGIR